MWYGYIAPLCGLLLTVQADGGISEALEIRIGGIRSCRGSIMVAVYDDERSFMNVEKAVVKEAINVEAAGCASPVLYRIHIPFGRYAIVVYHDVNGNGILDKNMFGVPAEAWGASNNARPHLRAPAFKECVFVHDVSHAAVSIEIH